MDCPRCDDPLVDYELAGREAAVCESCGYIGVAVDHHTELEAVESWEEALRRFQRRTAAEEESDETPEVVPAIVPVEADAGE